MVTQPELQAAYNVERAVLVAINQMGKDGEMRLSQVFSAEWTCKTQIRAMEVVAKMNGWTLEAD
jgi:hypothetical protein